MHADKIKKKIDMYGKARRRGLSNSRLDRYYDKPESLENVLHIANEIMKFGHVVKLYV